VSIQLHIERLVLDEALLGSDRAEAVRASIEHELARRLAQPGAIDALRGIGVEAGLPPVTLPPPTSRPGDHLGSRIATALQHGFGIQSDTHVAGRK
jgi:hypothetical protein